MKPVIRRFIVAFPDVRIEVHDMVQLPGKIAVRGEVTGAQEAFSSAFRA